VRLFTLPVQAGERDIDGNGHVNKMHNTSLGPSLPLT
jgi:hypothetical protein